MSEKRRFLDIWLIEANTVYKEVPFDVVADWVQQGRLLEEDMLRPSGTAEWRRVGDAHDLTVYVPKTPTEPPIESAVEPLEPVEAGFSWRKRHEEEDSEVDMIPLIDVSLVLLIFFMLTTKDIGGGGSGVPTPAAQFASVVNAPDTVWVGVNLTGEGADRKPIYSCGVGDTPAAEGDRDLTTQAQLLEHLSALMANRSNVELTINAHPEVRSGDVRQLTVELEKDPFRGKITRKFTGVSEKSS